MTGHKRKPETDTTAVLDTGGGLTDQYRHAVAAALPAGVDPPEAFWHDLESAVAAYFSLQQHRTFRPPKVELERWQHIDRLVSDLASELRTIRRQTPWSTFDFDQSWSARSLAALWEVKRKAEAGVFAYQTIGSAFSRRGHPHRAHLYGAICDLWRFELKQKLRYSRSETGIPSGPLIVFLAACLGPVLGSETPTASGLASIVNRKRRRLLDFFERKK